MATFKAAHVLDRRKLSDVFEWKLKNDGTAQHEEATVRENDSFPAHPERSLRGHAYLGDLAITVQCYSRDFPDLYPLGGLDSTTNQLGGIVVLQHWRLR